MQSVRLIMNTGCFFPANIRSINCVSITAVLPPARSIASLSCMLMCRSHSLLCKSWRWPWYGNPTLRLRHVCVDPRQSLHAWGCSLDLCMPWLSLTTSLETAFRSLFHFVPLQWCRSQPRRFICFSDRSLLLQPPRVRPLQLH